MRGLEILSFKYVLNGTNNECCFNLSALYHCFSSNKLSLVIHSRALVYRTILSQKAISISKIVST
jgi:hypothetical protein